MTRGVLKGNSGRPVSAVRQREIAEKGNLIAFFTGSETSGKRFVQGGFVVRAVSAFVRVVFTACPGDKDSLGIGNSGICGL